jgi:hypothetical protein
VSAETKVGLYVTGLTPQQAVRNPLLNGINNLQQIIGWGLMMVIRGIYSFNA